MNEPAFEPLPVTPETPKTTNKVILIVVGVIIACCCCLGALGTAIAFGEMFVEALSY